MGRSTRISICRWASRGDEAQNDFLWKDRVISRKERAFSGSNDSWHLTRYALGHFYVYFNTYQKALAFYEASDDTSPPRLATAYFHAEGVAPCARFWLVFVSLPANFLLKNYTRVTSGKIKHRRNKYSRQERPRWNLAAWAEQALAFARRSGKYAAVLDGLEY